MAVPDSVQLGRGAESMKNLCKLFCHLNNEPAVYEAELSEPARPDNLVTLYLKFRDLVLTIV